MASKVRFAQKRGRRTEGGARSPGYTEALHEKPGVPLAFWVLRGTQGPIFRTRRASCLRPAVVGIIVVGILAASPRCLFSEPPRVTCGLCQASDLEALFRWALVHVGVVSPGPIVICSSGLNDDRFWCILTTNWVPLQIIPIPYLEPTAKTPQKEPEKDPSKEPLKSNT